MAGPMLEQVSRFQLKNGLISEVHMNLCSYCTQGYLRGKWAVTPSYRLKPCWKKLQCSNYGNLRTVHYKGHLPKQFRTRHESHDKYVQACLPAGWAPVLSQTPVILSAFWITSSSSIFASVTSPSSNLYHLRTWVAGHLCKCPRKPHAQTINGCINSIKSSEN